MDVPTVRTIQHESAFGCWELAHGRPAPALRGLIRGYQVYIEDRTAFAKRREVPHPNIVLIMNLGSAIRVSGPGHQPGGTALGSFVAGLHDCHVLVEATGPMRCLQIDLTPFGAAHLLRTPMHELVNQMVSLSDLIGNKSDRLDAARDWPTCFALLDAVLGKRLSSRVSLSPGLLWAWRQLHVTGGLSPIAKLAQELGWSRKHLATQFRDQIGLPPKMLARVIRFDCTIRRLDGFDEPRWAEIAHACGYYDQAHFNREFRAFTGTTPGEYLRRVIPEGGVIGD